MHINILGTEYALKRMTGEEYPKLKLMNANGLCETYSKDIIIDSEIDCKTGKEYESIHLFENKVVRHEIIHAFFHESGLAHYCNNEELVDYLAIQFKKMYIAINSANVLE